MILFFISQHFFLSVLQLQKKLNRFVSDIIYSTINVVSEKMPVIIR